MNWSTLVHKIQETRTEDEVVNCTGADMVCVDMSVADISVLPHRGEAKALDCCGYNPREVVLSA